MPFVQTDRGRFFYAEYATLGPVVYLLHGLTAKSQDWGGIPDVLAKTGFHVFVFDMRGHGQSDGSTSSPQANPAFGYTPEDHGKDIAAWTEALGQSKIHVVGHSTGGRNALVFAGLFPEKTISLTVIDQTLNPDPDSWRKYMGRYLEFPTPFMDEPQLDRFLEKKFPKDLKRQVYYKGQFWKNDLGRWDWNYSTEAAWKTQKHGREKDAHDLLSKVRCRMLFMKGGDSRYVPPEEAELIRSLIPDGELVVVPGAEHAIFRDNPEGFLRVLVPFLISQSRGYSFKPVEKA